MHLLQSGVVIQYLFQFIMSTKVLAAKLVILWQRGYFANQLSERTFELPSRSTNSEDITLVKIGFFHTNSRKF